MNEMKNLFNEEELRLIFSNLVNLRNFSAKLREELRIRLADWKTSESCLGDVFLKFVP
jgi:hypothetical protein